MHIESIFHFFFFSSRRRHTRLQGDWSSDVCSSDLPFFGDIIAEGDFVRHDHAALTQTVFQLYDRYGRTLERMRRSEERRVGKECRSRVCWKQEKKQIKTEKRKGEKV